MERLGGLRLTARRRLALERVEALDHAPEVLLVEEVGRLEAVAVADAQLARGLRVCECEGGYGEDGDTAGWRVTCARLQVTGGGLGRATGCGRG